MVKPVSQKKENETYLSAEGRSSASECLTLYPQDIQNFRQKFSCYHARPKENLLG